MSGIIGSAGGKSGIIGETELDYEVGEWTASIETTSTNFTTTGRSTEGWYYKIGGIVECFFSVSINSPSGGAGNVVISGLPFVAEGYTISGDVRFGRTTLDDYDAGLVINKNESVINFYYNNSANNPTNMPYDHLHHTTPYMVGHITYPIYVPQNASL
tara:strand:+ start:166 stop:639 length:474 start_codon:yes stop_codon:yes gene_type:complete